jgi:hypothetical protein
LDFTGAQTLLGNEASKSIARNVGAITVLMAVAIDDAAANRQLLVISRSGSANQSRCGIASVPGAIRLYGRRTDADAVVILQATATPTSNRLFTGQVVYSSSDAYLYIDGLLSASSTSYLTDGSTSDTNSDSVSIGSGPTGDEPLDGWIAEVIVYPSALSMTDRARVEAYLALKWGISGVHAQATATSDPVGQWRDKSGNGRHFTQSVGSSRASRAAAVNGRPAVGFNGTSSQLTLSGVANAGLADTTGAASFVVFRPDSDSTYSVFHNSASAAHRDRFSDRSYPANFRGSRLEAIINGAMPTTALTVLGHSINVASNTHIVLLNGAAVHSAAQNFTGAGALWRGQTGVTYRVGNGPNSDFLSGVVCEVMQYGTAIDAFARQRIEQYLAAKWGITLAPQVSNADAQDWINRVYANGGQVSSVTASAVNTLCNSIDAAGIRDRFYRLGIFAGSNLAAALVPLYSGPSLGGTQYGNATDTNVGPFVSGDYAENNGLLGNASSKYLNTGFDASAAGLTTNSVHMSAIWPAYTQPANNSYQSVSIANSVINERFWISAFANTTPITAIESFLGQSGTFFVRDTIASTNGAAVSGGLWTASRTSLSSMRLYNGSTQKAENTSTVASAALPSTAMTVFVRWNGTAFFGYSAQRLRGYSVGLGMTDSQVGAFNSAMSDFQSALGRA